MKKRRSNKSFKNQSYEHLPGTRMGLFEYISREQTLIAPNITQYDKHFIVAKLEPMKDAAKAYYKTTLILCERAVIEITLSSTFESKAI